jgi:hypothetical protein
LENFLFPDEIVLKIFGYLGLGELIQCAKVSRRFNTICKDNSLGYRSSMLIMKAIQSLGKKVMEKDFQEQWLKGNFWDQRVTLWRRRRDC